MEEEKRKVTQRYKLKSPNYRVKNPNLSTLSHKT